MSYELPQKIRELTPYEPVSGAVRLHMDANESCFTLPDAMRQELAHRIAGIPLQLYPDAAAAECCALAAQRFGVRASQVVAGNGSDELISLLAFSLMEKGGRMAVLEKDFSMYQFYGELAELSVSVIKKDPDLRIDVDAVIRAIEKENIQMIVFSNPCNPTSLLLARDAVEQLVSSTSALVVVDEAYMEFAGSREESDALSMLHLVDKYENLCVLKTCSKAVGLAGIRLGFCIGGERITKALRSAKSPYNVNSITQAAGALALSHPAYLESCASKLREYIKSLYSGILHLRSDFPNQIGTVYETRTNFVYFEAPSAAQIAERLRAKGIAVRCFPGHLRISTGRPEENEELLSALRAILIGLSNSESK